MLITIQDSLLHAVIDSFGAQLISLTDNSGKEYIWQRNPEVWGRCSPLLFPIVGNCRNGKTMFHGNWYELPKHGFCKDCEFSVEKESKTSVTFSLISNETTKSFYPYDFRLSLTYRLENGRLSMDYLVENPMKEELGYCLGTHPGFVCPLESNEKFQDYCLEFEQVEHASSMVYNLNSLEFDVNRQGIVLENTHVLPLSYELFREDVVYFPEIRSRQVSLVHAVTGKGIRVSYPDFSSVAFWTPYGPQAPFLCIEPWNGSAIHSDEDDEFFHRHQIQILPAGKSRTYRMTIELLKNSR